MTNTPEESFVARAGIQLGGQGQQAMAELTRLLIVELRAFNKSSSKLTRLFIFVALLQLGVAIIQAVIALRS